MARSRTSETERASFADASRARIGEMIPPRAILAVVNFSDTARVALVLAARLAQHCGADLHVLYVEDPLLDAAADHAGIRLGRETREELQQFIVGAWPAAQCSPQSHVIAG